LCFFELSDAIHEFLPWCSAASLRA
jgi:hypothetical protein